MKNEKLITAGVIIALVVSIIAFAKTLGGDSLVSQDVAGSLNTMKTTSSTTTSSDGFFSKLFAKKTVTPREVNPVTVTDMGSIGLGGSASGTGMGTGGTPPAGGGDKPCHTTRETYDAKCYFQVMSYSESYNRVVNGTVAAHSADSLHFKSVTKEFNSTGATVGFATDASGFVTQYNLTNASGTVNWNSLASFNPSTNEWVANQIFVVPWAMIGGSYQQVPDTYTLTVRTTCNPTSVCYPAYINSTTGAMATYSINVQ